MHKEIAEIKRATLRDSLWSVVESGVRFAGDEAKKEEKESFRDNLIVIIESVLLNKIHIQTIQAILIVYVSIVLSSSDENDIAAKKITGSEVDLKKINQSLIVLHKICKEEAFRAALINVQAQFINMYLLDVEAPIFKLRRQLQGLQLHLPKNATDPVFATIQQQIQKTESEIKEINEKFKKAEQFCRQYRSSEVAPKFKM